MVQAVERLVWKCEALSSNSSMLVVLGFELRASLLQSRFYCLSHTSSSFCSGYFVDGVSNYFPGLNLKVIFLISASHVARITGLSLTVAKQAFYHLSHAPSPGCHIFAPAGFRS
jgi:hypothetical protein